MSDSNFKNLFNLFKPVESLSTALAEKGTQGIILLAIIFLSIWVPVTFIFWWFFSFLGEAKDFNALFINGSLLATIIVSVLCIAYFAAACFLTIRIIGAMVPTIKAEAEATKLLQDTFGGRVITSAGTVLTLPGDKVAAKTRTKQIMEALLNRVKSVLKVERVRSNIFTLREDGKLRILDDLHLNMIAMKHKDELSIAVPNGFFTVGRAFKYYRPALSIRDENGKWPYTDYHDKQHSLELKKVHPELLWIISMPIPCDIKPFKIVGGVLSIDCLGYVSDVAKMRELLPDIKQMHKLLPDIATAAALIAVLNRGTGLLEGTYTTPSVLSQKKQNEWKKYLINPKEFDPASCPEPSRDFVRTLAHVPGLEFFDRISEIEVASFLRNQLLT